MQYHFEVCNIIADVCNITFARVQYAGTNIAHHRFDIAHVETDIALLHSDIAHICCYSVDEEHIVYKARGQGTVCGKDTDSVLWTRPTLCQRHVLRFVDKAYFVPEARTKVCAQCRISSIEVRFWASSFDIFDDFDRIDLTVVFFKSIRFE